jgi:SAM-dependent methyltransferase
MRPQVDRREYQELADREKVHWWHASRRRILASIIDHLPLANAPSILEVGSGTGGNLQMLSRFGTVSAVETDTEARKIAEAATGIKFTAGSLPDSIPFPHQAFDLVAAFDVIEHIDDDLGSIEALYRATKPGGWFIATVPAYSWMWSEHDVKLHHKRRYTRGPFASIVRAAGFRVSRTSYFNTFLFPLAALIRLMQVSSGTSGEAERTLPRPWVNRILSIIFSSERFFLRNFAFPFGLSILVVGRRPLESTGE